MVLLRVAAIAALWLHGASAESLLKTLKRSAHGKHHGDRTFLALDDTHSSSFGGEFYRVFTQYEGLPIGEDALSASNWTKHTCDTNLGFAWTKDASGATVDQPLKLYTNAAGQPSGLGIIFKDYMPEPQKKWTTAAPVVGPAPSDSVFHVDIAFRSGNQCEANVRAEEIGEKLVNPAGESLEIPLTETGAAGAQWQKGSCFDSMGWHYFLNTAGGTLPMQADSQWRKGDMFPIVPMYYEDQIVAIFFSAVGSQGKFDKKWDPPELTDAGYCANMCDTEECGFQTDDVREVSDFSMMHIFFSDYSQVKCHPELECRGPCCEDQIPTQPPPMFTTWQIIALVIAGVVIVPTVCWAFFCRKQRSEAAGAEMS